MQAGDYRRGQQVYLEGQYYGTISALDMRRRFPDGSNGMALEVSFPRWGSQVVQVWLAPKLRL